MSQSRKSAGALMESPLMRVGKRADQAAMCGATAVPAFKAISGCEAGIDCAIYCLSESHPAKKGIVTRILAAIGHEAQLWRMACALLAEQARGAAIEDPDEYRALSSCWVPPAVNANLAWVQHILHHLAPASVAGFVLANGWMSSN